MPQSLSNILVHLVFSTKDRQPFLETKEIRNRLHAYLGGTFANLESPTVAIGGTADHVHVLLQLSPKWAIMEIVKRAKMESSKWIKQEWPKLDGFYWQAGYGVFSVNHSNRDMVSRYILNQEEHHKRQDFQDEYRHMLKLNRIDYSEQYVWG